LSKRKEGKTGLSPKNTQSVKCASEIANGVSSKHMPIQHPNKSKLKILRRKMRFIKLNPHTKSCHIASILRSLHWLRITERIE